MPQPSTNPPCSFIPRPEFPTRGPAELVDPDRRLSGSDARPTSPGSARTRALADARASSSRSSQAERRSNSSARTPGLDVRSALDPNTFFDVATYGRRAIELLIETFGVHQLAYGSDTPVVDSRPTLDAVRGFGDAVAHVLQTDTPSALLR